MRAWLPLLLISAFAACGPGGAPLDPGPGPTVPPTSVEDVPPARVPLDEAALEVVGFSPDERHFVFRARTPTDPLRVVDLGTGAVVTLDVGTRLSLRFPEASVFSPRSTGVLYRLDDPERSSPENSQYADLYFTTWDGQRTQIATDVYDDHFRFAGHGRYVVAVAREAVDNALVVYDLDDGTRRVLARGLERDVFESALANLPVIAEDSAVVYTVGDITYVQALDAAEPLAQLDHGLKFRVRLDGDVLLGQIVTDGGVVLVRRDLVTGVEQRSPAARQILVRDDGGWAFLIGPTGPDHLAPLALHDVARGITVDVGRGARPVFGPTGHAFAYDAEPGQLVRIDLDTGQRRRVGGPRVSYENTATFHGTRVLLSQHRVLPELNAELVLVDLEDDSVSLVAPDAGVGRALFVDRGHRIVWPRLTEDPTDVLPFETFVFELGSGVTTPFGRAVVQESPDGARALVARMGPDNRVFLHRWSDGAQVAVATGADVLLLGRAHAVLMVSGEDATAPRYSVVVLPD